MHTHTTTFSSLRIAVRKRLAAFFVVFFIVFTIAYLLLFSFSLVPAVNSQATIDNETTAGMSDSTLVSQGALEEVVSEARVLTVPESSSAALVAPQSITIDALKRTLPVNNPTSRAVADLDASLLTGVVRHPDSALLGQDGTVFILGHSSYLPSVNNRFFQAFNGIQALVWGDTIRLTADGVEYVYQVDNVYKASASELSVPIANTGPRLTIATCNSFGSNDDRFIVEAKLLYTEPIRG